MVKCFAIDKFQLNNQHVIIYHLTSALSYEFFQMLQVVYKKFILHCKCVSYRNYVDTK